MRAQVKTEGKNIPSEACLEIDNGERAMGSLGSVRKGSTNWAPYEVSWNCPPNMSPESLKVNVLIVWNGSIWIKDLELVTTPLGISPTSKHGGLTPAP